MEAAGQISQAWLLAEIGDSLPLDSDCFRLALSGFWLRHGQVLLLSAKKPSSQLGGRLLCLTSSLAQMGVEKEPSLLYTPPPRKWRFSWNRGDNLKLSRKMDMKDTKLTFVKWLCALEKKCIKSTLWVALHDFLCLDFRSSLTDAEILKERIFGSWEVF